MIWLDIASIVFVCVTMNHLGLMGIIEGIIGKTLPILNCPKCGSFWFTLIYIIGKMGILGSPSIPIVLAISFIASYSAIWLELLEGYIDTLYLKVYEKITANNNNDTFASDSNDGDSESTVSKLQQN